MAGPDAASTVEVPRPPADALEGFRRLKAASIVGLIGQILVWGSAISIWVVGSLFSPVPVTTKIAYGANGFTVSAGAVFDLNYLLIAGAAVALFSLVLTGRGLQTVSRAAPRFKVDPEVSLTTIGAVGLGMFILGWAVWLGSFVGPGTGPAQNPLSYTPVLASNLALAVDLLLVLGGILAFLGMLGLAVGSSKVSTTYDESAIELGGALSMLPIFSIIGCALSMIGLVRGERKLRRGWTPPPPPPPPPAPVYPPAMYPGGYSNVHPMAASGPQASWDSLAAVLVVVLVLLWVFLVPIALIIASNGLTHGPGNVPGGGGAATPTASSSSFTVIPIVLIGLAATAVLLPIVIVRNRRKRRRPEVQPVVRPPPPPPPPPAREEDPLNHLV